MKKAISLSLPQSQNSASDGYQSFIIGYYAMGEASGNILDTGPNGADLTTGTAPTATTSLVTNTGSVGARVFDGSTQYLRSADMGSIYERDGIFSMIPHRVQLGTYYYVPDLTVDFWCYCDASFASARTFTSLGGNLTAGSGNCLLAIRRSALALQIYYQYNTTSNTLTSSLNIETTRRVYVQVAIGPSSDGDETNCSIHARVWQRGTDASGLANNVTFVGEEIWDNQPRPNTSGRFTYITAGGMYDGSSLLDGRLTGLRWSASFLPKENGDFQALLGCATWNEDQLYSSGNYASHLKVFVENSEGDMIDLTSLIGNDYVVSARWQDDVDTLVTAATITLARQVGEFNLSPEDADSVLNLDSSFVFDPLLELTRKVSIRVAVVPLGYTPHSSHFIQVWNGKITEIEFGTPTINISCSDTGVDLERRFNEEERFLGLLDRSTVYWDATSSNRLRVNSPNNFEANDIFYVLNTAVAGDTIRYVHSVDASYIRAANTSASEDSGPCTPVAPATQEANRLLRTNSYTDTLWVRHDQDWYVTGFKAEVGPLLSALDNIAIEVGSNVRYVWSDYHQMHNLEWYDPNRTNSSMATISTNSVLEFTRASTNIANIRNVCQVGFGDREDDTGTGLVRPLNSYTASNSDSINRYGRMWCAVFNAQHIDTIAEATTLAQTIVNDLAEPEISYVARLNYRRTVELGDVYTFSGNGVQFSEDTTLAVYGVEHDFSGGVATTTLYLKGKPAGRNKGWFRRFISAERAKTPSVAVPDVQGFTGTYNALTGNIQIQWIPHQQTQIDRRYMLRLHFGASADEIATPTAANLLGEFEYKNGQHLFSGLGLENYYFKACLVDEYGNTGAYTAAAYVDATVSADALITGSGSPYRNNVASGSDVLLLNENTVAVTELIDSGTIFTKTSANGRFTAPYGGTYAINVNASVNDLSLTSLSNYVYIVIKRYNSSNVLLETVFGFSFQCIYATISRVNASASIALNGTDYITVSVGSDDSGGAFTYDVTQVNVRFTLTTS